MLINSVATFEELELKKHYLHPKLNINSGREGTLDCILYGYPKFYYHVILQVGSNNLGIFMKSFLVAIKTSSIQTFQPISVIYRRGNFVNHQWGCLYIYHPLSYPLVDS